MIICFSTKSGSEYELNTDDQLIRRLSGVRPPTPRQGDDEKWKGYYDVEMWDGGLLIHWNEYGNATLTSIIEKVWAKYPVAQSARLGGAYPGDGPSEGWGW